MTIHNGDFQKSAKICTLTNQVCYSGKCASCDTAKNPPLNTIDIDELEGHL